MLKGSLELCRAVAAYYVKFTLRYTIIMYFHSLCLLHQMLTCCSQVKAGCNHEFRDGLHSLIQTRKEDCYIIIKPNGCPGIIAGE